MSLLKIVWLSLSRRISKTVLLFSIVFLMGNVLCASLAISTSMNSLKNDFLRQVGHHITLERTIENNIYSFPYDETNQKSIDDFIQQLEEMKTQESVQYYDANFVLEGLTSKQLSFKNAFIEHPCDLYHGLFVYGVSDFHFIDAVENKVTLIEGRTFTQEEMEIGANKMIVSNQFLVDNQPISVGQKIQLDQVIYNDLHQEQFKESKEYEVIGIFKKNEQITNTEVYNSDNYSARVYLPLSTVKEEYEQFMILKSEYPIGIDTFNLEMKSINIKLNSAEDEHLLNQYFSKSTLLSKAYAVKSGKNIFDSVSAPLEFLSSTAHTLALVSAASIIGLLSIIILIFLKDRRYEIGILYAMGEKKIRIVAQHVFETLVICLTAITLAMFSGQIFAKQISRQMIDRQLNESTHLVVGEYSQDELMQQYEIKFDQDFILRVYGTTLIIGCLSSLCPVMRILKLKPKKTLM